MESKSLIQSDEETLNTLHRGSFRLSLVSKAEINRWGSFTVYVLCKKKWLESRN